MLSILFSNQLEVMYPEIFLGLVAFGMLLLGRSVRNPAVYTSYHHGFTLNMGKLLSTAFINGYITSAQPFWTDFILFGFFKPNAASAAKKAFIVTRVGDLLFIIGLAMLYSLLNAAGVSGPLSIPYLISNSGAVVSAIGGQNLTI